MSFGDMFKSTKERERERQREQYRASMEVERAKQNLNGQIEAQRKQRDAAWKRARDFLRDGQKQAAQRELNAVRMAEVRIAGLEKRSFVYTQKATSLEMAKTDQEFAKALSSLNSAINVDAGKVIDTMTDVGMSMAEQDSITSVIEGEYAKDMNGLEQSDAIPSVDEMMANLEKEVVADVSGGAGIKAGNDIAAGIGEGRRRLQELMDGKDGK